jgi:hypothetical protein
MNMFEIAKKDFPDLLMTDVKVAHYGGDTISGTFGIEFPVPENVVIPATYKIIDQLPVTK